MGGIPLLAMGSISPRYATVSSTGVAVPMRHVLHSAVVARVASSLQLHSLGLESWLGSRPSSLPAWLS